MTLEPYARILRKRQVQVVVGASVLAGLAVGLPLAIVLTVQRETGDFASAGLVAASIAIAGAVTNPARGRLVDRRGQSRTLPPLALASFTALVALVLAARAGAPLAILVALGLAYGAAYPPLLSSMRPLWVDLVDHPDQLGPAYALQAVLLEVFYICGPLAAALLIGLGAPDAAALALGACQLVGVLAFAATPASRAWRGQPSEAGSAGAMASPGMRALVVIDAPVGALFGMLDVAVPAFARAEGAAATAGTALAALAAASMLGGVAYGARAGVPASPARRYAVLLAALAVLTVPLIFVRSTAGLIVAMALAGLLVAPSSAVGLGLLDVVAPVGTAAEATSWIGTAYQLGVAAGTAVAGALVDGPGTTAAFAVACGLGGASALLAFVAVPWLRPYRA